MAAKSAYIDYVLPSGAFQNGQFYWRAAPSIVRVALRSVILGPQENVMVSGAKNATAIIDVQAKLSTQTKLNNGYYLLGYKGFLLSRRSVFGDFVSRLLLLNRLLCLVINQY